MDASSDFMAKVRLPLFLALTAACLLPVVQTPFALLAGLIFGVTLGNPHPKTIAKLTKVVLQVSVVGLGFGLSIEHVVKVGRDGLWLSLSTIFLAIILGKVTGRFLGVKPNTSTLISVGTAICGGSAIAAVSPVIHAEPDEISVSMAIVFTLNAIALFLFPWVGQHLNLQPEQFGLWSALAIHDTSSVVGASALFGEKALAIATTVKLARSIWILPLAFGFALLTKSKGKIAVPWFIFLFLGAATLNSIFPQYLAVFSVLNATARQVLCVVLFWIGSSMNRTYILSIGWRPFILASTLWVSLALSSLLLVMG